MIGNQRWLARKAIFRRPDEQIRPSEYDVDQLDESAAKAFVVGHHYSGSYPAARERFGLWRRGELVGVAVFSHPSNDRVLTNVFGGTARESIELGRFVLLDEVPGNGETWFLARCFKVLKSLGLRGVVSFSDPVPRRGADGSPIFPGHAGTIYQALNAAYLSRGRARSLFVLPDGSILSDRTMQKIRTRERGWEHATGQLEAFGAERLNPDEDSRLWLSTWAGRLTTRLKHGGNHRYAWALNSQRLRSVAPFPKQVDA